MEKISVEAEGFLASIKRELVNHRFTRGQAAYDVKTAFAGVERSAITMLVWGVWSGRDTISS